jgi:hypothetical protein
MHQPLFNLACALLLAGSSAAQAQLLPPPKPGDEQPRADITRKAPGGVVSSRGPGTQTEDDIYVGRKVQGNETPGPAARPLTPQGPLAAPANPQPVRPMVGQDGGTQGRPYVQFNRTASPTAGQDGGTQGLVASGPAVKELNPKALTPQGPLAAPANPQLVRPAMPLAAPGSAGTPKPLLGTKSRATGDEDEMDDLDIQRRKAQGLPDNKPTSPQRKEQPGSEQPRGERRQ